MPQATPNLNRAWRRTFWHVYDNIGLLITINILWFFFSLTVLLIPPATASLFYIAYLIVLDKPVKLKYFFRYLPYFFLKSISVLLIILIACSLFIFNIRFYVQHSYLFGAILAGMTFWLFVFFLLALIYIFPLLCRNKSIYKTIQYSLLLVFSNFRITLVLFMIFVFFLFLEIILPIASVAILSVFMQNAFLEIEKQYNKEIDIIEPRRSFQGLLKIWNFS